MKEHNQVKQDYATVKTTNETGVRTVDHLTQTFNTTGEVVSGALKTTGEVVGGAFNWVVEHPVESLVTTAFAIGAVVAVAFAPEIIAFLATVTSLKLLGGAVTSTLIGISIFNDKGE